MRESKPSEMSAVYQVAERSDKIISVIIKTTVRFNTRVRLY
jgi:hypothetical protein